MNKKVIFLGLASLFSLTSCGKSVIGPSEKELNELADSFVYKEQSDSYKATMYSIQVDDNYIVFDEGKAYAQFSGKELPVTAESEKDSDTGATYIRADGKTYDVLGEEFANSSKFNPCEHTKYVSALDNPKLPAKFRTNEPFLQVFDVISVDDDGDSLSYYMKRETDTDYLADSRVDSTNSFYNVDDLILYSNGPSDFYYKSVVRDGKMIVSHLFHDPDEEYKLKDSFETVEVSSLTTTLLDHYFANGKRYSYSLKQASGITNKYSFYQNGVRYIVIDSSGNEQYDINYVPFQRLVNNDNSAIYLLGYKVNSDKTLSNKYYVCKVKQDLSTTGVTDQIEPLSRIGKEYQFNGKIKNYDENETIEFMRDDEFLITRKNNTYYTKLGVNDVRSFENVDVSKYIVRDCVTFFHEVASNVSIVKAGETSLQTFNDVTQIVSKDFGLFVRGKELYFGSSRIWKLNDSIERQYGSITSTTKFVDGDKKMVVLNLFVIGSYPHDLPLFITNGTPWALPEEVE